MPRTCALCAPARASRVTPRCCRCPAAARCCGAAGPGAEGRAAAAGRARGRRRPPTLTTASPRRAPGPSPCTTSAAATTTASVSWAPGPRTASRVSTIISSLLLTPPASIDCLPGTLYLFKDLLMTRKIFISTCFQTGGQFRRGRGDQAEQQGRGGGAEGAGPGPETLQTQETQGVALSSVIMVTRTRNKHHLDY